MRKRWKYFNNNRLFPTITIAITFILIHTQIYGIEWISSFGGKIRSAVVYDNRAYLAQRDTIRIMDISDKKHFREIGTYIDSGLAIGQMAIKWPVIFYEIHFRSDFVDIGTVDISDPLHPREIENNFHSRRGEHMIPEIQGSTLRILLDGSEMWRYDIADPLSPDFLKQTEDAPTKNHDTNDITTPGKEKLPIFPRNIVYAGCVRNIKAAGKALYVLDEEKSAKLIDVTDPKNPRYRGVARNSDKLKKMMAANPTDWRSSVTLNKRYVFEGKRLSEDDGPGKKILIRDISNSGHSRIIDESIQVEYSGNDQFYGLRIIGNLLFILSECHRTSLKFYGLSIYDISNIREPVFVGAYPKYSNGFDCEGRIAIETAPGGIAFDGNCLYISDDENGLTILRITQQDQQNL